MMSNLKRNLKVNFFPGIILLIIAITMLFYHLAEIPPLSFDEGWTLSTARNWLERGQYALLLQGNPVSAINLAKPFSVTGPIALSFAIFGVGTWQGRLPSIISLLLAIFLIFVLCRKLFNLRVAYLSLFALLLMATPAANPWVIGRMALAEAPMVLYLVIGYLCLLPALNGNKFALFIAMIFWGLALDSKAHVIPFLSVSLLAPAIISAIKKQWKYLKVLLLAWIGSFPFFLLLFIIQKLLFTDYPVYGGTLQGFFSLGIFVISPTIRLITLQNILTYGIPSLIGILIGFRSVYRLVKSDTILNAEFYNRFAILSLVIAWFLWFTLLSLGWSRYYFPVAFFASIFIANWLSDLIDQLQKLLSGGISHNILARVRIYASVILVIFAIIINLYFLRYQFITGNNAPSMVAVYVEKNAPPGALIETYESELIFLMNNPVHYPSDQITVDLNRNTFLNQNVPISYDPSPENFYYLINGPSGKMANLYAAMINQGQLQLVSRIGEYDIYQRIP